MRHLPLAFEPYGSDASRFLTRGPGYIVHLDSRSAVLTLRETSPRPRRDARGRSEARDERRAAIRMRLVGALDGRPIGEDRLPGVSNYLVGPPEAWRVAVPNYQRAIFESVYAKTDVIYYGAANGHLEFDFRLHPGAMHTDIRLAFEGAEAITIEDKGLRIRTAAGDLRLKAPVAYQEGATGRVAVPAAFRRFKGGQIGFELGSYDRSKILLIDPVLDFSTVFGGNFGQDLPLDLAVDAAGSAYVVGDTSSSDYPTSFGALDETYGGGIADGFVTKFDPSGSAIVYSTFFGGSGYDRISGVALDTVGNAYLTGFTTSADLPLAGALQSQPGGGFDVFVAKLDASGAALRYSTFLGGSSYEEATAIAIDATGAAVVTGYVESTDFPVTAGAVQTLRGGFADGFVTRVAPDGGSLLFSTFLGGGFFDYGTGIAIDPAGRFLVTGKTTSTDFPTYLASQPTLRGSASDAFVTALTQDGSGFHYSTYLGGFGDADDQAEEIAVAADGSAIVTGSTYCTNTGFPVVSPFQPLCGGEREAFVTKYAPDGQSIVFSSYLGGGQLEWGFGVGFGVGDSVWLTGRTASADFPTQEPLFTGALTGVDDAYVVHVSPDGSTRLFSSFIEGTTEGEAVALSGDAAYIAGIAGSEGFLVKIVDIAARPDAYSTNEEVALAVPAPGVLSNDEGVTSVSLSRVPANAASFQLDADGSFVYLPATDFSGTDTFSYVASNGSVESAPTSVTLTVLPSNDPPVAIADTFSVLEDAPLNLDAPGVLANDGDPDGDALTSVLVAPPSNGTLILELDGSFAYVPDPDFFGSDSFSYAADDGTALSSQAVVSILVAPVNDRPSASDDAYSLAEDSTLTVPAAGVLANDSDAEGDTLTAVLVAGPTHGSVVLNPSGGFAYTPLANFSGTDTFRYAARDLSGESDPATVSLTVAPMNDAVVPQGDSFAASEDSSLSVGAPGVLGNDTDPDGDALAAILESPPSNGTLSLAADGSFVYTPNASFFGMDAFTYRVGDGDTLSEPITVNLSVSGAPDPPSTEPDSYSIEEDGILSVPAETGVLANDSDPDLVGLSATLIDLPADGSISFAASGAFTYEPSPDFHGSNTFTYLAWNDSFSSSLVTVTLTVTPVNDAPSLTTDQAKANEGVALTIDVLSNDQSLGDAPVTLTAGPASMGTTQVTPERRVIYTPAPDRAGFDSFTYSVTDQDGETASASVLVEVAPFGEPGGSDSFGALVQGVQVFDPFGCDDFEDPPFVAGQLSASELVQCGSRALGPWAEATVTLDVGARFQARAAASGGTTDETAFAGSYLQAHDVYTVLPGSSELPTGSVVPIFVRVHTKRTIENPDYAGLLVKWDVERRLGTETSDVFDHCAQYGTPQSSPSACALSGGAGSTDSVEDFLIGQFELGARLRLDAAVELIGESGGWVAEFLQNGFVDPKVAEADVSISLCSTIVGVVIQGASGAVGSCGGDIRVSYAEAVQSVFGASTLVAGKDTAVAVHLGNDFGRPIETKVRFEIQRSGLPTAEITEIVTIPANCPSKRYYFPNPDPTSADICDLPSDALGVLPGTVEPIPGTDWSVSVTAVPVDSLIETNSTNNAPPLAPITYSVKETILAPVYFRVHCSGGDCVTDPDGYAVLSDAEYDEAIFWSDLHAKAMLPLGQLYEPSRCTDAGNDCVVSGDSRKCPGPATEATITCPGISADIDSADRVMDLLYPSKDLSVLMLPTSYWLYHQHNEINGETYRKDPRDVVLVKAEAPSGRNVYNAHLSTFTHELAHWAVYSLQGTPQAAIPVHGYWVGCKDATGDPSLSCETPADADNLMGPSGRSAPGRWIELDTYEAVLAELKTTPDPPLLAIHGTLSRDGVPSVTWMADIGNGKLNKSDGDLITIEVIDDLGKVLSSLPIGSPAKFDDSSSAPGIQRTDVLGMNPRVHYPIGAALVRFRRGSEIVLTVNPLSGTLRSAIEAIPSRGYDKNPEQRQKALLNKVDAFEKVLSADKPGARQKLRHDIRKAVEEWVTDYSGTALEFSKAKILALIDSIDARLEARLQATETPTPTPQP